MFPYLRFFVIFNMVVNSIFIKRNKNHCFLNHLLLFEVKDFTRLAKMLQLIGSGMQSSTKSNVIIAFTLIQF